MTTKTIKKKQSNIPLLTDEDLIRGVRGSNNSGQFLTELIHRHSGIYVTMVNNYTPSNKSSQKSHKDDLIGDKNYYIYQAALKYDASKNTKFSTYLGNETRWMCLNIYNKEKKRRITDIDLTKASSKQIAASDEAHNDTHSRADFLSKVMLIVKKDPDSRISKIFSMRYLDGESNKVTPWKKISEHLQLSIQGCINIHNKAIAKIKKELDKDI
jgi:RNA polymerase sigma factor (sigma-70 family)